MKSLTKQQFKVAWLITLGYTVDEISVKLFISDHTVISHKKEIFKKLDVRNIAGVAREFVLAHKELFIVPLFLLVQCLSVFVNNETQERLNNGKKFNRTTKVRRKDEA